MARLGWETGVIELYLPLGCLRGACNSHTVFKVAGLEGEGLRSDTLVKTHLWGW